MKVLSIFLFLLCIPIHSMADTYEYFIKLGINDIKYDVHISIRESSIRIYDSFDLSWSYNDTMPQCVNSNNTKILLRDFHVENVKNMRNIIFISYGFLCNEDPSQVKYVAIYKGVSYILSGIPLTVSVSDNWNNISKTKISYNVSDTLRANGELFSFMINSWPSQAIFIR
ncbi:hypothetical protein CTQ56_004440 [Salmonella enterica subsp. houtenae]|uniref:Uncharacterized protein n=5 Tax=Salmonella enterica TaxID=28901 RepID=A0A5Z7DBP6_SALER|nr:hypothetical protein CHD23_17860 [Salmonella enterica]EAA3682880.1 hypothetical protein [Salmonella enterica subsp. houtenae]EAU5132289.1 hypothetical protein [Salmonella enterica subsp. enterica serovar Oranienburg]ECH8282712.1 hypothetical protein [Salmonella enterica subsp. enterica]EDQ1018124.1 hypothetical protein [Salmonella enterica subsp. houtenae serovar 50:z4,z23:-]EDW0441655.1 hypothetical protein [Salmonella enterica subsp. arizonae serovar 50:z4,z23:-]EDW5431694.1 hypothetical